MQKSLDTFELLLPSSSKEIVYVTKLSKIRTCRGCHRCSVLLFDGSPITKVIRKKSQDHLDLGCPWIPWPDLMYLYQEFCRASIYNYVEAQYISILHSVSTQGYQENTTTKLLWTEIKTLEEHIRQSYHKKMQLTRTYLLQVMKMSTKF